MSEIGKFVLLRRGVVLINTLAPEGTGQRDLLLETNAVALIGSVGRDSFSVIPILRGKDGHFSRLDAAFHTYVNQPLSSFRTFVAFEDAVQFL